MKEVSLKDLIRGTEEMFTLLYELSPQSSFDSKNFRRRMIDVKLWKECLRKDCFTEDEKTKLYIELASLLHSADIKLEEYLELVKSYDMYH